MKKIQSKQHYILFTVASVVLILIVGAIFYCNHLQNHWRKHIKRGLLKWQVEMILPIAKDLDGPSSRFNYTGSYLLKDGSIFYYHYRNKLSMPEVIDNTLFEYDIIVWRLESCFIQENNSNKITSLIPEPASTETE